MHALSEMPHLYKPREKNLRRWRAILVTGKTKSWKFFRWRAQRSGVWQYFGFFATDGEYSEPDKKKRKYVLCKILGCKKKKIKYSGNTSNMRFHLQCSHPIAFSTLQTSCSSKQIKSKEVKESKQLC